MLHSSGFAPDAAKLRSRRVARARSCPRCCSGGAAQPAHDLGAGRRCAVAAAVKKSAMCKDKLGGSGGAHEAGESQPLVAHAERHNTHPCVK